jgi:hypothetical protein
MRSIPRTIARNAGVLSARLGRPSQAYPLPITIQSIPSSHLVRQTIPTLTHRFNFSTSTMSAPPLKTPVLTAEAPKPIPGVYNQAIVAGGFVYCSGAVAMDPETMEIISGDLQAHTVSNTTFDLQGKVWCANIW